MACPNATLCEAVGTSLSGVGVVVPITDGNAGLPIAVPETASLAGVACRSADACVAVGAGKLEGVLVPIRTSTPSGAQVIPGTPVVASGTVSLEGVACPSASTCEAVGANPSGVGVAVSITDDIPGVPKPSPETALRGVACASTSACVAVGISHSTGGSDVVVPILNGVPGTPHVVVGTYGLRGVACPSSSRCQAVGAGKLEGVVVPIVNGVPGTPTVASGSVDLAGVTCPSASTCEAVGASPSGGQSVAMTIIDGTPVGHQVVPGTMLQAVACPSASTREAVGTVPGGGGGVVATVDAVPGRTSTAVTLSSTDAGVGIPGVILTARIVPGAAAGTVAFSDSGISIVGCEIVPVTADSATCVTSFATPRIHTITAAYSGDAVERSRFY